MCDANWGPQDQSSKRNSSTTPSELETFKSRSISGYLLFLLGPLHWCSKRQKITAHSSCESEIYATDECVKEITHIRHVLEDLSVLHLCIAKPVPVYNDNSACVNWSKHTTSKTIRHIQMRDNSVREQQQANEVDVRHCEGKTNLSDFLSKEDKDTKHFQQLRNQVVTAPSAI